MRFPRPALVPLFAVLATVFPAAATTSAHQVFLTPKAISSLPATAIATGDFNGDGIPDLAVGTDNGLYILLGTGGGSFSQGAEYTLTLGPGSITVADLNGDGHLDLVTTNDGPYVTVWPGNGDGTFQAQQNYSTLRGALAVTVGDFNGDGKPDLMVAANSNNGRGGLSFLANKGGGTFAPAVNFGNTLAPSSVSAGDFNHDGKLDLVVGNFMGVNVIPGNGDGTFQTPIFYKIGSNAYCNSIVIADFNADGFLDLAVNNVFGASPGGAGTISILLGNGDGSFRPPVSYFDSVEPGNLAIADFNHDGKLDLVTSGLTGTGILLGNGDGTFGTASYYFGEGSLAVADFNADGDFDIVIGGFYTGVHLMFGNGDGTFQGNLTNFAAVSVLSPGGMATGDFNGDGKLDVATAAGLTLDVLLGNGDGTFGLPITTVLGGYLATAIATGDFNGDGKLDVAEVDLDGGLYILLGKGDGTFQKPVFYSAPGTDFVGVADLNHDGKLDIVVPSKQLGYVSVFLGNGDGTFTSIGTFPVPDPYSLAFADFNKDGNLDLVTSSSNVLLGNGDGTFQAPQGYGVNGQGVTTGDFNGDGNADFLVTASESNRTFADVFLGEGDGNFGSPISSATGILGGPMVTADFNHDGNLDVAMAGSYAGCCGGFFAMNLLLGKGDGTFVAPVGYLQGFEGSAIALGDFNNDGAPDLVLTDQLGFTVLLNVRGTTAKTVSSPNPSKVGQSVSFTTVVKPTVVGSAQVAGAIFGTVTFFDGSTRLGSVSVSEGLVNFNTKTLAAGQHTITAVYSGSASYNPATSPALVQVVNP